MDNPLCDVATRIATLAVELGWTPPGWRDRGAGSMWSRMLDPLDAIARVHTRPSRRVA